MKEDYKQRIELFNFHFTSLYKHNSEEEFNFKTKNYDDLKLFVDAWLNKDKKETEIIAKIFLQKCLNITQHRDFEFISHEDHIKLLKISDYLQQSIEPRIQPLELHIDVDLNQFVYLFRVLQENKVINNTRKELIPILSKLLNHQEDVIKKYMYATDEFPKCIFPKCKWSDLESIPNERK